MLARKFVLVVLVAFMGAPLRSEAPKNNEADIKKQDSVKKRLNQLFYWQLSDELKLSTTEEKKLIEIIETVQAKRESMIADREKLVLSFSEIEKISDEKARGKSFEKALATYREINNGLSSLDAEEQNKLTKEIGFERVAKFFVIRDRLARRVMTVLQNPK